MKINTRSITLAATLTALCAVTGFAPGVFFLPVMVAATTLSVGMVAFVGLAFGCISLAYSYIMPISLVSMAFVEAPYIAIIPRILAALGAFAVYKLIERLAKPKSRPARVATCSAAAATGSILNTAIVVGMLVLIMPELTLGELTMIAYVPSMLISGAIEFACMAVIVPPISLTLDKVVLHRGNKTKAVAAVSDGAVTSEQAQENDTVPESNETSDEDRSAADLQSNIQP